MHLLKVHLCGLPMQLKVMLCSQDERKKQQDVKLLSHISVYMTSKAKVEKLHGAGLPLNTVIYWPRF